ncbi:MAG: arsenate reductase ArsC [Bacteroidota bacterium]|nr:arsenate reductase ArsC [Bacteroidota bacterium]
MDVESAGTMATFVHPSVIKVMNEIGIDISSHRFKSMLDFVDQKFDLIITVCEEIDSICPIWIGAGEKFHLGFYDPVRAKGTEEQVLDEFRRLRDEMRGKIVSYLKKFFNI